MRARTQKTGHRFHTHFLFRLGRGRDCPPPLGGARYEVVAFTTLAMGMFDTGMAVLVEPVAALGWKALAALEVLLCLCLLLGITWRAAQFGDRHAWLPLAIAPTRRKTADRSKGQSGQGAEKEQVYFTKDEVLSSAQ